ncbi:MAG: CHRD domain-containing protein [Armatimonadia bacterium]|nr:CHRD domain-containing protein [Armatimonadia bacterium]
MDMRGLRALIVLASIAALTVGLLAVQASASPGSHMKSTFKAHLDGDSTGSRGQGQAIFKLSKDGSEIHYKLNVANIDEITMVHIHLADEPGGNGPPVVWLYPDAPPQAAPSGRVNGTLAEGTITADSLVGPLAGESLEDLVNAFRGGLTYVNVHTVDHAGGEIRGDIS